MLGCFIAPSGELPVTRVYSQCNWLVSYCRLDSIREVINYCLFSATVSLLVQGSASYIPLADGLNELICTEAATDRIGIENKDEEGEDVWQYPEVDCVDIFSCGLTNEVCLRCLIDIADC